MGLGPNVADGVLLMVDPLPVGGSPSTRTTDFQSRVTRGGNATRYPAPICHW